MEAALLLIRDRGRDRAVHIGRRWVVVDSDAVAGLALPAAIRIVCEAAPALAIELELIPPAAIIAAFKRGHAAWRRRMVARQLGQVRGPLIASAKQGRSRCSGQQRPQCSLTSGVARLTRKRATASTPVRTVPSTAW